MSEGLQRPPVAGVLGFQFATGERREGSSGSAGGPAEVRGVGAFPHRRFTEFVRGGAQSQQVQRRRHECIQIDLIPLDFTPRREEWLRIYLRVTPIKGRVDAGLLQKLLDTHAHGPAGERWEVQHVSCKGLLAVRQNTEAADAAIGVGFVAVDGVLRLQKWLMERGTFPNPHMTRLGVVLRGVPLILCDEAGISLLPGSSEQWRWDLSPSSWKGNSQWWRLWSGRESPQCAVGYLSGHRQGVFCGGGPPAGRPRAVPVSLRVATSKAGRGRTGREGTWHALRQHFKI